MGGWLLDAAKGKSTGEPPAGMRPDLTQQIGALQLRAQVAKEILANLQHVEQVLDAFARDASKRATLPALQPYLRQIHGALMVLRFDRAAEALAICEKMIDGCAEKDLATPPTTSTGSPRACPASASSSSPACTAASRPSRRSSCSSSATASGAMRPPSLATHDAHARRRPGRACRRVGRDQTIKFDLLEPARR